MKDRNIGLDFCRIGGMMGIVILHILGCGGVLSAGGEHSWGCWIAWFLEIAAYCAVDLFALLTGYLCCKKTKFSSFRIIELLLSMLFYTAVITGTFLVFEPSMLPSLKKIIISLCPVLKPSPYWYITSYMLVFLLMPCLNLVIQKLSDSALIKLCILTFALLAVIPSVIGVDYFNLASGFSPAWLAVCYIWGGAYRRLGKQILDGVEWLVFLVSTGIVLLIRFLEIRYPGYLMQYTSPFMVINAVMLLQLCAKHHGNPHAGTIKLVTYLSGAAFDVYLLHCHILIYDHLIQGNFAWIANLYPLVIPVMVALCAGAIYLTGTFTATIRKGFFRIFRIDRLNEKLAEIADHVIVREI